MKKIQNYIKTKILYKSSVLHDILIGFVMVLTGYFYYYENKQIVYNIENTVSVNHIIKIAMGILIIAIWLYLSFQNGVKKRNSYLICALCFWIIPQIIKYFIDISGNTVYTSPIQKSFLVLLKYLSAINYLSLKPFGDMVNKYIGFSYVITLNTIILLFVITFAVGSLTGDYFRKKEDENKLYKIVKQ